MRCGRTVHLVRGGSVKNASANAQTAVKNETKRFPKRPHHSWIFFCDEMSKGATEHSQVRRLIADDVIRFVYPLRSKQPRIMRAPKSARARERDTALATLPRGGATESKRKRSLGCAPNYVWLVNANALSDACQITSGCGVRAHVQSQTNNG